MYEKDTTTADGMVVEWDVQVPVSDGALLSVDVFRPLDGPPVPVILAAGPYAKGLEFATGYPRQWEVLEEHPDALAGSSNRYQSWEHADPEQFVPHGYALVRVDTRGTGGSPGDVDFFSARETQDLHDVIEWAAAQPWSTDKVGLLGISYLATNQWQVAALAPPHLAAICPWEGANDFYREYARHGGIASEFLPTWQPRQVGAYQYGNPDAPVNPNNGRRVTGDETLSEAERRARMDDLGRVLASREFHDDFYAERSAVLEDVRVPVLSAANWGGMALHSRGNFEGFRRAGSAQKWLEVHGLEHWTEFYTAYGRTLQLEFFDHFLRGVDNGWDTRPAVQLQVRHVDGFVERFEHEWPLARTQWQRWALDPAGERLVAPATDGEPVAPPAGEVTFEARSAGVTFRTAPFAAQTEVTGPLVAHLAVSSTTTDADLFVTLSLRDPAGVEALFVTAMEPQAPVTQGWLRLTHRKVDEELSEPWRPWHPHDEPLPVVPGEVYDVDVEIWPTSVVVPAGWTLELTVQGQDYDHGLPDRPTWHGREHFGSGPYWHELPGDRDRPQFSGRTTVHAGPDHPSHLLLPVVPPTVPQP